MMLIVSAGCNTPLALLRVGPGVLVARVTGHRGPAGPRTPSSWIGCPRRVRSGCAGDTDAFLAARRTRGIGGRARAEKVGSGNRRGLGEWLRRALFRA